MDIPKGFTPKNVKDLTDLLKEIKNKNSEEIIKIRCIYFRDQMTSSSRSSEVLLKVKCPEVLGIKCDFYKKDNAPGCWIKGRECYLLEDWREKD